MAFTMPGNAIGAFEDAAGGVIVITTEWTPDPDIIAQHLMNAASHFEDLEKPLLASKAIARADMQHRFDTETDPSGAAWQPLDEEYLRNKIASGFPEEILHRGGDLERSATSPSAFIVTGHDLFFSAAGLPPYGMFHQFGSGEDNVGLSAEQRSRIKANRLNKLGLDELGGGHDSMGIGSGNALPKREFIGTSAEAEEAIFNVFDLWFAEGVNIAISGSGVVQERLPGGRFGSKINLL